MTRILFLPDAHSQVTLESEALPEAIVQAVNAGFWRLPAPYAAWFSARLQAVQQGEVVILTPADTAAPKPSLPGGASLTPRQREIVLALSQGLTSKEIARRLGVQPRTVEYHIAHLKQRLDARSRPELVSRAAALGWI